MPKHTWLKVICGLKIDKIIYIYTSQFEFYDTAQIRERDNLKEKNLNICFSKKTLAPKFCNLVNKSPFSFIF